jgi:hypothetical protein
MWEVRAAAGRLADLVTHVLGWAGPDAQVYRSPAGDPDERLVVIDPRRRPVPDLPADLVARPPHAWDFDRL